MPEDQKDAIIRELHSMYLTTDLYEIYQMFLEDQRLPKLPHVPKEERILAYEDVYPILYLKYRLLKKQPTRQIRHVIIDEMQDYSYLQYRILHIMFDCSMTILGDRAQTLEPGQIDVLEFLPGLWGKKTRVLKLNRSYRNTLEIAEYADSICHVEGVEYFERHGKPVAWMRASSKQELILSLKSKLHQKNGEFETAAVLAMNEREAKEIYDALKKVQEEHDDLSLPLHYLDHNSTRFRKGITVTTWYLAKGLEFDQVYVWPGDRYSVFYDPYRYISATRAMHELTVCEYV